MPKVTVEGYLNYSGQLVVSVGMGRLSRELTREEAYQLRDRLTIELTRCDREADAPCRYCGNGDEQCTCP